MCPPEICHLERDGLRVEARERRELLEQDLPLREGMDVDTPLAAAYTTPPEEMIRVDDLAAAIRWLVRLSPRCLIPEISFLRPDGHFGDRDDV